MCKIKFLGALLHFYCVILTLVRCHAVLTLNLPLCKCIETLLLCKDHYDDCFVSHNNTPYFQ